MRSCKGRRRRDAPEHNRLRLWSESLIQERSRRARNLTFRQRSEKSSAERFFRLGAASLRSGFPVFEQLRLRPTLLITYLYTYSYMSSCTAQPSAQTALQKEKLLIKLRRELACRGHLLYNLTFFSSCFFFS